MKNNDALYIQKIIEYCDIAESLLDEYERDYLLFKSSKSFQLSTSMCILQIGEYVSRLSDEFKESHDNIPWRKIKGMRNFAAHQYEHIEFEVLWHTITEELPELKEMLFATHYVNFKDFRNRVLDKAVNDINYYTDLSVSYETRMKGKKVVSIIFFIETKKHLDGYLAYRNTIEEINKRNGQINGQISMFDKEESEFER